MIQVKKLQKLMLACAAIILAFGIGVGVYANDYYRADETAVAAMANGSGVTVYQTEDGLTVFAPELPRAGLIFYPGGKVEHTAYAPLLRAMAEEDILCVLTQMPLNLAVLDINAADGVREKFADVECWYMGGHSLGGSMAASYLEKHVSEYEGLILLASYSTTGLTDTDLKVLSLYGTEDGVLNGEKYAQYRGNLPADTVEIVLEGGNHAQFGSYGAQDGDGSASILPEEQLKQTVSHIVQLIFS